MIAGFFAGELNCARPPGKGKSAFTRTGAPRLAPPGCRYARALSRLWILPIKTRHALELADIKAVAAAAEAADLDNHLAVPIASVDGGAHLLWLQRLDGAAALSAHIAPAKARTAALGRRESKVYEDSINGGRFSF